MKNMLHTIYTDFSSPEEGLQRVGAMIEFLVQVYSSDIGKNLSSTSREGVIVTIELIRKILDQMEQSL